VSANWDKGVLKISMAKKAEAKPRQIKVNVGSEKTSKPRFMARQRKPAATRNGRRLTSAPIDLGPTLLLRPARIPPES